MHCELEARNQTYLSHNKQLRQYLLAFQHPSDNEAMFLGVLVQDAQEWSLFLRGFRQHSGHRQPCHQNQYPLMIQVIVFLGRYTFPPERSQRERF